MEQIVSIPTEKVVMAFVATCIEATASTLGVDYSVVFSKMQRLEMIEKYIYPNYETLHRESRENLIKDIIGYIEMREGRL